MFQVDEMQEKKKKVAMIVMIVTLIISVTGATFAYFIITPASNNSVYGEAAQAELSLDITRFLPEADDWEASDKVMAPYASNMLGDVMSSDSPCLDEYGNIACQAYEIVATNKSTAQIVVDGTIAYSGTTDMPNLRWKLVSSDSRLSNAEAATSLATAEVREITESTAYFLDNDLSMAPVNSDNSIKYYYLVLWINALVDENGEHMVQFDHGTYMASVTFESSNGTGVTSTFVS